MRGASAWVEVADDVAEQCGEATERRAAVQQMRHGAQKVAEQVAWRLHRSDEDVDRARVYDETEQVEVDRADVEREDLAGRVGDGQWCRERRVHEIQHATANGGDCSRDRASGGEYAVDDADARDRRGRVGQAIDDIDDQAAGRLRCPEGRRVRCGCRGEHGDRGSTKSEDRRDRRDKDEASHVCLLLILFRCAALPQHPGPRTRIARLLRWCGWPGR